MKSIRNVECGPGSRFRRFEVCRSELSRKFLNCLILACGLGSHDTVLSDTDPLGSGLYCELGIKYDSVLLQRLLTPWHKGKILVERVGVFFRLGVKRLHDLAQNAF